ncbi:MAG: pyridoxamine kinase [Oscillospiraceae bacterium]|nr:pyridoxamine kinase [Oscillospiraceae bacterium]
MQEPMLPKLKRIAAVHDLSGLGKCSLTVALPVISATGVECACIPTALLSTHTGEFTGWTLRDLSDEMLPIARHWKSTGAQFDGVYTGYLANPAQTHTLEQVIDLISGPDTMLIVDPVMADNGSYYSNMGEEMCAAFRHLIRRADVITPNITEAALLTGTAYTPDGHDEHYLRCMFDTLASLGPRMITITGIRADGMIGNAAFDAETGETFRALRPMHDGLFYGTGDIFASSLAALLVRGASLCDSLEIATALTDDSIARSLRHDTPRRFGVDFEGALPVYVDRVRNLFWRDPSLNLSD